MPPTTIVSDIPVQLLVWGRFASFTRDDTPAERDTYPLLTPPAAEAVLQKVYWKPGFNYEVSRIEVLSPVRILPWRGNDLKDQPGPRGTDALRNRALRLRRVLHQPAYLIEARLVMAPEAATVRDLAKAQATFLRRARAGQCEEQPYLGMREYPAYFRLPEPGETLDPYDADADLGPIPLVRRGVPDPQGPVTLTRHQHDAATGEWRSEQFRGRLESEYMTGTVRRGVLHVPAYRRPA